MAMQRRQKATSEGTGVFVPVDDCKFGKSYPEVLEFLTRSRWEDGGERETGTVMFVCDDGKLKMWLCDKDVGQSCWITGQSITELLRRACKVLEGAEADWRPWEDKGRGRRRK